MGPAIVSPRFACVYVDNSNIFHEGQRYAEQQRGEDRRWFRIQFDRFIELMADGRTIQELVWGGSIPPPTDSVWRRLNALGIRPDLIPRAEGGEHETVDHRIQLLMHRHVRRHRATPGTIVLCTGDGRGYDEQEGFLYDVEGFVHDGWGLDVVSWSHSLNRRLRAFAEAHGRFIPLEAYYDRVTFIEGSRRSLP